MLEWDDLRYFLAAARNGSLSGAARVLGTTQPTMGRRVEAFEARIGAKLFRRTPSGLALTAIGQAILDHVTRMDEAALAVERVATGHDSGLSGNVRLTAPEWYGARVLSPHLGAFCALHPDIMIELVTDARPMSLTQREADIALRLRRFEQDGLVQRKVADMPFGLYAAPSYLDRHGAPDFASGAMGSAFVAMSEALTEATAETAWLDEVAPKARIAFRSNSRDAQAAAAAAGAGLACLARTLGDGWPGLVRLETPTPIPMREVWLGVHADTRTIPRVRALIDFLCDELQQMHQPAGV
ncbi:transcriptional regulator, LysR family [Rhizobiales bacterium GAS191]|nr:transcriptional regulator, LysR family [Rhizobiales bacterium GAS113]SEC73293.1 transcriptional regulator, LysR family [Rhizobiales bacterium GAS191]